LRNLAQRYETNPTLPSASVSKTLLRVSRHFWKKIFGGVDYFPYLCNSNQYTYYIMTIKKKHFFLIALISCGFAFSIWAFVNYQTKRKAKERIDNALAQRFDEAMDAAFPLLENYAVAMKDRADSIVNMAQKSKEDTSHSYSDAFYKLWQQYARSEQGLKCYNMIEEYEYFRISPVIEVLVNSGNKKENESEAIKKLTWAGTLLREPYLFGYDSIMNASKEARQFVSDCLEVFEPYRNNNDNIQAWRDLMLGRQRQ